MNDHNPNPYEVGVQANAKADRASNKKIPLSETQRRWTWFALIYIPLFFLPTVEYFQRDVPLGRIPLWVAYVAIFDTEFFVVSIIAIFLHVVVSLLTSSFLLRLQRIK